MTLRLAISLSAIAALSACASVDATSGAPGRSTIATASLIGADGSSKGQATLAAAGNAVALRLEATGLPAGTLGTHLHMVGKCEPTGFTSAGGHLNPDAKQHGTMNPLGSHLGDLPNMTVGADGKGALTATLHGSRAKVEADLFDADGTAIVVHAGPDDYQTDPAGNSGARIACGVFTRT